MKSAYPILFFLMLMTPIAVQAGPTRQSEDAVKLNSEAAWVAGWNFANCVVKRDRIGVTAILDMMRTSPGVEVNHKALAKGVQKLADKYGDCLAPGDKLDGKMSVFLKIMAGAVFVNKFSGNTLPDYSQSPWLYTAKSVERAEPQEKSAKLFSLFSECVFRSQPTDVLALLKSRPFANEEAAVFVKLQPAMGSCIPAQEGVQMKLSKDTVRSYLAMAAYLVDQVYEFTKPKQTSQMIREQGRRYA